MIKSYQASKNSAEINYAIRDVVLPARQLEKKGIEVIKLNIGDPGKFDFDAPENMKKRYCKAIMDGLNCYGDSEGDIELREAIKEREKAKNGVDIDVNDIQVTTGVTEAMKMFLGTSLNVGDEILVPGPTYPPYVSLTKFYGGIPKAYTTIEEEGWKPDIEDIRKKITDKTKAITLINPNNPTGALYDKNTLKKIVDLAGEYEIPILSDEIYDMMTYEKNHTSPGSLSEDVPVVIMNGFSKGYFATGWRLGYIYTIDPENRLFEIKEAIKKLARIRLSPNTPAQKAAAVGIRGPKDYLKEYMKKLRNRRDYAYRRFNEIENISTQKPEGSFYIFPKVEKGPWKDSEEFVLDILHNANVLFVQGSGFGGGGEQHFRSVFLPPIETLETAFENLEKHIKKL